jgi:hypothetical protein
MLSIPFTPTAMSAQTSPVLEGCTVLPADNIWNTPVDELAVDPRSQSYISSIGSNDHLHPDFGSGTWNGYPIGIPYNVVTSGQAASTVDFYYPRESDPGPYPIPVNPKIEGNPNSGDRHILIIERDTCTVYELFDASYEQGGWHAGSGAIFDLNSHALRPDTWTSADAAGLPILPGLVRYEEVASGQINHALRFTVNQTRKAYLWPARHYASDLIGLQYPPMGQRFRLKADYNIQAFSPHVRVILQALKTYGMILADNGSDWYISGVPDERWDNDMLVSQLHQVPGSAFEAVNSSILMVSQDSGQALQLDFQFSLALPIIRR